MPKKTLNHTFKIKKIVNKKFEINKAVIYLSNNTNYFYLTLRFFFSSAFRNAITDTQLTAGESRMKKNVLNKNKCVAPW